VERFDVAAYAKQVGPDTVLARDVGRFEHFADGHLFVHANGPRPILGDFRYALVPNSDNALWGIQLDPDRPQEHVQRVQFQRDMSSPQGQAFLAMLTGTFPGQVLAKDLEKALAAPSTAVVVPPAAANIETKSSGS